MEVLGQLAWWTVANPEVNRGDLAKVLDEIGAPSPNPALPIDAFRRLQEGVKATYAPEGSDVTVNLELHVAPGTNRRVVRHIVRTVKREGVTVDIAKIGEAIFHKPPGNQQHRARLVVALDRPVANLPDREAIERYVDTVKVEYERGIAYLDPQAGRRVVRAYLTLVHAVYVDGPYFIPREEDAARLVRVLDAMGGDCRAQIAPLVDDEPRRRMVAEALARATSRGEVSPALMETYESLALPLPDRSST